MKIYIDMDGVLVDMVSYWLKRYNEDCNQNIAVSDVQDFDITKVIPLEHHQWILYYLREPGFFGPSLQPHVDAIEVFQKICEENEQVFVATTPHTKSETCERDKRKWLEHHAPFFHIKDAIFTHHKHLMAKNGDVLLDDRPETLKKWKDSGGIAVCFERPWNKNCEATHIVKSWQDFYWLLERIKEGSAFVEKL